MAVREVLTWDSAENVEVEVREVTMVKPAVAVEANQGRLWLSNVDQSFANSATSTETIYVYKARLESEMAAANVRREPAAGLRESLARALVLFCPCTGRLGIDSATGRYEIRLTGEGAMFVEAEANVELENLGYGTGIVPPAAVAKQLFIRFADLEQQQEPPLLAVQVTRFKCGGWVLGVTTHHVLVDGFSSVHFATAWATLARGQETADWFVFELSRAALQQRSPPLVEFDHAMFYEESGVDAATTTRQALFFRFRGKQLKHLKQRIVLQEPAAVSDHDHETITTGVTSLEAVAALIWRARTRALGMTGQQATKLAVTVNVRDKMKPPLAHGFMGNAVVAAPCVATADQLCSQPLSFAVRIIRGAIAGITDDYVRSYIDWLEQRKFAVPQLPASGMALTSWTGMDFHLYDFGWGAPVRFGHATTSEVVDSCYCKAFLISGKNRTDIDMLISLHPSALHRFQHEITYGLMNEVDARQTRATL